MHQPTVLSPPIRCDRPLAGLKSAPAARSACFLLIAACLWSTPVLSCSLVNERAAALDATTLAGFYWQISIVLGGATIGIGLHARQWLLPALTVILLVIHPAWSVPPGHGPDCVFVNVLASQFVLTVISSLLAWQTVRTLRSRKQA